MARYSTATELADDLLHWNQSSTQEHRELQIIPKGLRSFDADDADFFLDLLPGPRNRDGLPESIQFWKSRIEETDPDKTFSVGLIYGPSGCGKSSLVKAGLLPRLSQEVVAIYVEVTPDETATRILRGLRKQFPELPDDSGLVETFSFLRRSEGRKVVIVLDQFEQWLHAHRSEQGTELVRALRQCDGATLQTPTRRPAVLLRGVGSRQSSCGALQHQQNLLWRISVHAPSYLERRASTQWMCNAAS